MARSADAVLSEEERWRRAIDNEDLVNEMMEYFLYAQVSAQPMCIYMYVAWADSFF